MITWEGRLFVLDRRLCLQLLPASDQECASVTTTEGDTADKEERSATPDSNVSPGGSV